MSIEGILSAYSYYATPVYSVLPSAEKQENSDARTLSLDSQDINDTATVSDEAMKRYSQEKSVNKIDESASYSDSKGQNSSSANSYTQELTTAEQKYVSELKSEDTRVKNHEQAHISASGGLSVSGASYEYETGPDGQKYAVAGEVSISFSKTENPEINLERAQAMKRAALAPSDPSSQDRAVAAHADQLIAQALAEISKAKSEEAKTGESSEPFVFDDAKISDAASVFEKES